MPSVALFVESENEWPTPPRGNIAAASSASRYPRLPQTIGGGRPVQVKLYFKDGGLSSLVGGTPALDGQAAVSDPVYLYYRTSSYLLVSKIVRSDDDKHRELILEYPFPDKHSGNGAFQIPQRPKVSVKTVESDVRHAIASGWDPLSRGKVVVYRIS